QFDLARVDALEIEYVVDQADEAIGVTDCDVQHPLCLFCNWTEQPAAEKTECSTNGCQRRSQFVADCRHEFALQTLNDATLSHIAKHDHCAQMVAVLVNHRRR